MVDERRYPQNYIDITCIKCPLCDKDMVKDRWHACKNVLQSDEYVNEVEGIRLLWHSKFGWRKHALRRNKIIGRLSFADVFNTVNRDKNYTPAGNWENPRAIKNIY